MVSMLLSGCSAIIAKSGTDLRQLRTREHVRAELGEPHQTGTTPSGTVYDEYFTRRKISHPGRATAAFMSAGMTFGVTEIILLPLEIGLTTRELVWGQLIRFSYDDTNQVSRLTIDPE